MKAFAPIFDTKNRWENPENQTFRVGRGLEKLVDFLDVELFGNVHTYL